MRFLANENFPGDAVALLCSRGHDVVWVRSDAPGSADAEIIARAQSEGRILLTFDKDFGDLVFRIGLPATSGVILFRIAPTSPFGVAKKALAVLESRDDWAGHFAVIEENRVRMTVLPSRKQKGQ